MLTLAMILAVQGKVIEMGLIVIAGSISMAFLNIDRMKMFKGAGFEAQLKQSVEEAHATVKQLRALATASAEGALTTLMAANVMSGTTLAERLILHDRLIGSLKDIGVPEPQIDEAEMLWNKGVAILYHRGIRFLLDGGGEENPIDSNTVPAVRAASRQFQCLLRLERWDAPSSNAMRTFIEEKSLMSPEIDELLNDYLHFEQTGTIKRRDVFVTL